MGVSTRALNAKIAEIDAIGVSSSLFQRLMQLVLSQVYFEIDATAYC